MGSNCITVFLNSTAKDLSLNLRKEKDTRSRQICQLCNDKKNFACQFSVIEMKIVTTEAGAFGPIFGPGHF